MAQMSKDKEPLKLMPLDDLKKVVEGLLRVPKGETEKPKRTKRNTKTQ